jgi:hypothetical protein
MRCRQGSLKSPALSLELAVIRIMSLQGRDPRHGCREPIRQGVLALRASILTRVCLLANLSGNADQRCLADYADASSDWVILPAAMSFTMVPSRASSR